MVFLFFLGVVHSLLVVERSSICERGEVKNKENIKKAIIIS